MLCSCSVNRHEGMWMMIHDWSMEETRKVSVLHLIKTFFIFYGDGMPQNLFFRTSRSMHMISLVSTRHLALHSASRLRHLHYLLRAIKGWACCGCASYHESTEADQNTRIRIQISCTRFPPVVIFFFLLLPQRRTFFHPMTAASVSPFCPSEKKKPQTRTCLVDEEATD